MPALFAFQRTDAAVLKRIARENRTNTGNKTGVNYADPCFPTVRAHICTPHTAIPAARRVKTTWTDALGNSYTGMKLILGTGIVCLQERMKAEPERITVSDIDESPTSQTLVTKRDPRTNAARYIRVFNFCYESYKPKPPGQCNEVLADTSTGALTPTSDLCGEIIDCEESLLFVVQDLAGDFYIVKECHDLCESSSSSSSQSSSSKKSSSSSSSESSSFSSSFSSSASSESTSQSEGSIVRSSSSSSSEGGCDYSGTITVGKGDLSCVDGQIQESRQEIRVKDGLICDVKDIAPAYADCEETSGCEVSFNETKVVPDGENYLLKTRTVSVSFDPCFVDYGPWTEYKICAPCPPDSSSSSIDSSSIAPSEDISSDAAQSEFPCCPDPESLPVTLTCTLTSDCPQLDGQVFTLTKTVYMSGTVEYNTTAGVISQTCGIFTLNASVSLTCNAGDNEWSARLQDLSSGEIGVLTSMTCDPFYMEVTFDISEGGNATHGYCCPGSSPIVTAIISE